MKKYILLSFLFLLLVAGVSCTNSSNNSNNSNGPEFTEYKIERGLIELTVASSGRIVSNLDVEIKCKASGEVINLPFDISDPVTKGSLVVELDPVDEQRNVQKSQVALHSAQARLEKAKTSLEIAETDLENAKKQANIDLEVAQTRAKDARAKADRVKKLLEQKLAGEEEYETAETNAINAEGNLEIALIRLEELKTEEIALEQKRQDVLLAKADVETSQINLSIAQQRLKETNVYAPMDGIVTERVVQAGQIISSGISNTGGGTKIMTISDLSRLFVLASVDESDIGSVQPGQNVIITADAYPGKIFSGEVERISPIGVNQSNVVTFEVRIEVLSENKSLLKPEMTTDVEIEVAREEDAVIVPVGAITRQKGIQTVTIVKADGSQEEREVEIGINNGEIIEVTSGLAEGETILITEGLYESQWRKRMEEARRNRPPGPGFGRH